MKLYAHGQTPGIHGSFGGGTPDPPPPPVEAANTLQSKAVYRGVDLLCEGEIEGLVDGHKSIFLQDVPLQAVDGSYNFDGVKVWTRTGMPGQAPVEGFPEVETTRAVGVEVTVAGGEIVRTVTDANVDAAYVLVTVPALFEQRDNGDMVGATVHFRIQINGGPVISKSIEGKCTSPYQENYRIALPAGEAPWNLRLARTTADSDSQKLQNKIVWTSYTEVIDHKMEYPDTAYVAAEVDAELFGNRVPKRSYHIRGLKVAVPTGYTPPYKDTNGIWQAAEYPPTWDGTWQSPQYTSCPAWCFYALLTSHRFGAGLPAPDKWALYPIAQYCDQLVPDGQGGMEPRFTLNAAITSQHEAFQLINLLASCFRGMCWWGPGTITASQDAPADPQILACPANVRNGLFSYEGSALSARHTVALVTWNDPANHFKPVIEAVEDSEAIARFGYRPAEVAAFGCTSRGMANRVGRWLLDSEQNETELVGYQAGLDHAFVRPGMIVEVADPFYASVRMGGRLKSAGVDTVELDAAVVLADSETYTLTCVLGEADADGCPVVEQRGVLTVSDGLEHASLAVSPPFSGAPQAGAVWIITGSDIAPRRFRVLSKVEADGYYTITALFHDHTKYARVEQGIHLEQPAYATPIRTGQVLPPGGCDLAPATYYTPAGLKNLLRFSWQASIDERVGGYRVQHRHEGGNWTTVEAPTAFMAEVRDVQVGLYEFRVQALSRDGGASIWVDDSLTVDEPAMPDVTGLELVDGATATIFTGGEAKFRWTPTAVSDVATSGGTDPWFFSYIVEIVKEDTVVRTEYPVTNEYRYSLAKNTVDGGPDRSFSIRVYQLGNLGQVSATPAELTVSNPAPSLAGFAPDVSAIFKGLLIDWSQMSGGDADLSSFKIYLDTSDDPTTFVAEVAANTTNWTAFGLDTGVNHKVKVVPYDAFGIGVASAVANGTPLILTAIDMELTESIAITDSVENDAATLAKLYDRNTVSDGVAYTVSGEDVWLQYDLAIETYVDRVVVHTADANARVYVGYEQAGGSWSFLKAGAGYDLTGDGELLAAADQTDAQTNYWQLAEGRNAATLPQRVTARKCRLYLTGSYATTIYELVFVREVIAEQMVTDNLAALSANLGTVTAGVVQSSDWSSTAGLQIDLNNKTISAGGSATPKFHLAADGSVLFRSAASGERLEVTSDCIKVYDANGVVRVQMGDLTA